MLANNFRRCLVHRTVRNQWRCLSSSKPPDSILSHAHAHAHAHADYLNQINEMNTEREVMYNFHDSEYDAWGSFESGKTYGPTVLEEGSALKPEDLLGGSDLYDKAERIADSISSQAQAQARAQAQAQTQPFEQPFEPQHEEQYDDVDESALFEKFGKIAQSQSSPPPQQFTHLTGDSTTVRMVPITQKPHTIRRATATTLIWFPPNIAKLLNLDQCQSQNQNQQPEINCPKGPILTTAKIAGIQAVKKTADLIPLCHPLLPTAINIDMGSSEKNEMLISCTVECNHGTGVEMEALVGCTVAGLTVIDMCKSVGGGVVLKDTRITAKSGGKSGLKVF